VSYWHAAGCSLLQSTACPFLGSNGELAAGLGSRRGGIQTLGADNKQQEWQLGAEACMHSCEAVYTDFVSCRPSVAEDTMPPWMGRLRRGG
jgi:hypothetical protein